MTGFGPSAGFSPALMMAPDSAETGEPTMNNVNVKVEGTKLILEIDGTVDLGPSSSGKTRMVATTSGNKKIQVGDRELHVGLNVFTK